MWTYVQFSGQLLHAPGQLVALGYIGSPAGKNNSQEQCIADVGRIPQGSYTIYVARRSIGSRLISAKRVNGALVPDGNVSGWQVKPARALQGSVRPVSERTVRFKSSYSGEVFGT